MSSQQWKAWERQACRDMGAQRRPSIGPQGWARGSDDDGTAWCYLEAKYLKHYQLRSSWIVKARQAAKAEGRPWVIALKEHNDRHTGLFVCSWSTGVELSALAGLNPLWNAGDGSSRRSTLSARSILESTLEPF